MAQGMLDISIVQPDQGAPGINIGDTLTVDIGTVIDADNPGGLVDITTMTFAWEFEQTPGAGDWAPVANAAGDQMIGRTLVITADLGLDGLSLRVVGSFRDAEGMPEIVQSVPTAPVALAATGAPTAGADILVGTNGADLINALAGDDQILALAGDDILIGGPGNDILEGGANTIPGLGDVAVFFGPLDNFAFVVTPDGILEVVDIAAVQEDAVIGIETILIIDVPMADADVQALIDSLRAGDPTPAGVTLFSVADILDGDLIVGTANADALVGTDFGDTIIGLGGDDTIDGGVGNDIIFGDGVDPAAGLPDGVDGDDIIGWRVGDGRDVIDGGGNTAIGDTFDVRGSDGGDTFRIYTVASLTAVQVIQFGPLAAGTEIVVTRDDGLTGEAVIAELDNIEELVINADPVVAAGGAVGGDTIQIIGDFATTSLALNTITINGSSGNDVIDISGLTSAHRIVFNGKGGNDTIIGTMRPQDVIELAPGDNLADCIEADNGDGTSTLYTTTGSFTYATPSTPSQAPHIVEFGQADTVIDPTPPPVDPVVVPSPSVPAGPITSFGSSANDTKVGSAGHDILTGEDGDDTLLGLDGNDTLVGGAGADHLVGGAGDDLVFGNGGNDFILSGAGDDTVLAGSGDDTVFADAGNDLIFGEAGRDVVHAGAGNDTIFAAVGDGNDVYHGDAGIDTLDFEAVTSNLIVDLGTVGIGSASSMESGADTLSSIENVVGGSGNDTIYASNAANVLNGGAGHDVFVFRSAQAANGDSIEGFSSGDRIDLGPLYSGLTFDFDTAMSADFTMAGSLRLEIVGGDTLIQGNTDNDAEADFQIRVVGVTDLDKANFV